MPIRLNRITLAALGYMRTLGAPAGLKDDDRAAEKSGAPDFDDLVEAGEEAYDEILTNMTDARVKLGEQIRSSVSQALADLGLATKQEIDNLRNDLDLTKDKK